MRNLNFCIKLLINKRLRCYAMQQMRNAHSAAKMQSTEFFGAQHCMGLVEKNDYENYLCTLLLNGDIRRHAFALRAFNVEIAKVGTNISEEMIGRMRSQFWYDSIEKCFDTKKSYITDHPVLRELKHTIDSHKLTKTYLKRMIKARDHSPNKQFESLKQMEEYAEKAFSSLFYLLVEVHKVRNVHVDHALSHLGKAQGLITLLRSIPHTGRFQAVNIPQDILMRHGVSQERIMRDAPKDKGVADCVFEVATAAHQHLEMARKLKDRVPTHLLKLFLPGVIVDRYLDRLRNSDFKLTDQNCLRRDNMLPMALYWSNLRNKF